MPLFSPVLSPGRSEGTSSAAFELLMINCYIDFINLFIFKWLATSVRNPKFPNSSPAATFVQR